MVPAIWFFPQFDTRYTDVLQEEIFFCIVDLKMSFFDAISMPVSWRKYVVYKKSEINQKELKELEAIKHKTSAVRVSRPRIR